PFEALVEALKPERSLSHSPLFQVAFSLHNTEQAAMTLPGLTFTPLAQATTTAHYELELHAQEVGGTIQLGWVYNSDLFEADTIARLADSFRVLLEGIVAAPATSIARLPLASQQDLQKVIHHFNQTAQAFSENLCVHQLFEQALVRHPDAIAVQYEEMTLSYRLLNERANQLAHYLRSLGVQPDRVVALYMERSIEMVLALYAVMKAGAAYLPIDPDHPAERVRYMLDDAQADIVLTQAALQAALPDGAYRVLAVDALADTLAKESTENPDADAIGLRADHLAYVIYTSGSTGRPKGVMVPHRGVVNRIEWMQRSYPLDSQDRVLQKTPYSFDVSVWEFIWPLMAGARLVVARAQGHRDPRYLEDTIRHHGITILHFVPSMLAQMLDGSAWGELHSVRRVFCSGEALSKNHVAHYRASGTRALLHNLYGPTEASIDVSYWDCAQDHDGATIPIGRPIQNLRLYVLDPLGQPTPIGVFGQLHIGGVGLARGYLNRPELTHEKFMDNPLQGFAGDILYKTGDLARWTAGGYLEFAGRIDHQVKLHGLRIELEEIEAQLLGTGLIKDCVVVAEDARLLAYVVATEGNAQADDIERLAKDHLRRVLPAYMMPAGFIVLDALPLSANGKVDRKALPKGDPRSRRKAGYVAPRNQIEQQLCEVWQEVLKLERVGIYDNFFEFGGHSLLVMTLLERLRRRGMNIEAKTVFVAPVLADMAVAITEQNASVEKAAALVNGAGDNANARAQSDDTETVTL
ncbi:amino acid adenylation domain-containing protein, partial [Dyella sp.]|uniref:non-ribosomal peptide synthetase n=2 Tax=Dyella sp. TaxID=1869338 RepID=UPI002D785517